MRNYTEQNFGQHVREALFWSTKENMQGINDALSSIKVVSTESNVASDYADVAKAVRQAICDFIVNGFFENKYDMFFKNMAYGDVVVLRSGRIFYVKKDGNVVYPKISIYNGSGDEVLFIVRNGRLVSVKTSSAVVPDDFVATKEKVSENSVLKIKNVIGYPEWALTAEEGKWDRPSKPKFGRVDIEAEIHKLTGLASMRIPMKSDVFKEKKDDVVKFAPGEKYMKTSEVSAESSVPEHLGVVKETRLKVGGYMYYSESGVISKSKILDVIDMSSVPGKGGNWAAMMENGKSLRLTLGEDKMLIPISSASRVKDELIIRKIFPKFFSKYSEGAFKESEITFTGRLVYLTRKIDQSGTFYQAKIKVNGISAGKTTTTNKMLKLSRQ